MSRQERVEIRRGPVETAKREKNLIVAGDPSGARELEKVLKLIKGSFGKTTKCCATGTCEV